MVLRVKFWVLPLVSCSLHPVFLARERGIRKKDAFQALGLLFEDSAFSEPRCSVGAVGHWPVSTPAFGNDIDVP